MLGICRLARLEEKVCNDSGCDSLAVMLRLTTVRFQQAAAQGGGRMQESVSTVHGLEFHKRFWGEGW